MIMGDEEGAWRDGEEMRAAGGGRPGRAPENVYINWDYLTWNLTAWLNETMADAEANGGAGTGVSSAGPGIADVYARLHNAEAADLALKTSIDDPNDPAGAALVHHVRGRLAAEAGDALTALAEMEIYGTAYTNPAVSYNNPGYQCWIAPAEEAAGIRTRRMPSSRCPAGSSIATASARTFSPAAGTCLARRRRMPRLSRSHPTYPRRTTPGARHSQSTPISPAPRRNSQMQASAVRIGPIR